MNEQEILERANQYISEEKDESFRSEVEALVAKKDMAELEDRFYQSLEFGTGGLRGVMGGGTNRMNTLNISKATQGLATYIIKAFPEEAKAGTLSACIAYDSRNNHDKFSDITARVFAANGIKAYLFTGMRPTPELSFAIRELGCKTGVVVTASHNPPKYNGYKAYWADGAQVVEPHDKGIIDEVNAVKEVKLISREDAIKQGKLVLIDKEIDEKFQFRLYQDASYTASELVNLINNLGKKGFSDLIGDKGKSNLFESYNTTSFENLQMELLNNPSVVIQIFNRIDLNRLSRGERQIFILALYWSIIELSEKEIPFIIDTPYARIDASHRKEISEKFFPNISKQVVILSTDEEINEEYYRLLKPRIACEYLLINDESQNKTSVENRYFFEAKI